MKPFNKETMAPVVHKLNHLFEQYQKARARQIEKGLCLHTFYGFVMDNAPELVFTPFVKHVVHKKSIRLNTQESDPDPLIQRYWVRKHIASALRSRKIRRFKQRSGPHRELLQFTCELRVQYRGYRDDVRSRRGCFQLVEAAWLSSCTPRVHGPGKFASKTPADLYPLFACSGELEFSQREDHKAAILCSRRGTFWDLGRDGGGQWELRFLIQGRIPEAAVSVVRRLGSGRKNGGHIHVNCQNDETVGDAVYTGFFYHLTWFRLLVPKYRRGHRHCGVGATAPDFRGAGAVKFAALSANTWRRTGTVEVRIWPTSKSANTWRKRAEFLQSLARWSVEVGAPRNPAMDVDITGCPAFAEWSRWAVKETPSAYRWAVSELRKAARRGTDHFARTAAPRILEAAGLKP